mgnify:CR=1 FL=1
MDKTGTLTHGNFTVKTINPANNYTKEELLSLCASCAKNFLSPYCYQYYQ